MQLPAFSSNLLQGWDGLILVVLGLLIFGKRLPEMGDTIARWIIEIKNWLDR